MVSWSPFFKGKNFVMLPTRCLLSLALGTSRLIAAIKEVREDLEVNLCVLVMEINFATFFFLQLLMVENPNCSDFCASNTVFLFKFWHLQKTQPACHFYLFGEKKLGTNCEAELSAHFKWTAQGDLQNADTLGKIIFWQLVSCHFYKRKASFTDWFYINLLP